MAYNKYGKRVWLSLYQYARLYPNENLFYNVDFRTKENQCKWCSGELKNKRQQSFCSKECAKKFADICTWNRGHAALPYKILCRDKFICQDCGTFLGDTNEHGMDLPVGIGAEVHHIIPVSEGGSDNQSNLITLCTECHKQRHRKMGD